LSFIPLIASSSSLQETEAGVKYFIIQAVGRGLILMAGIISINPLTHTSLPIIARAAFIVSILIKLGIAPCHHWLPHVIARIP
jgi:NADH:ubiquinone oxidoreductase subunit 2 (subunit N)